MGNVYFAVGGAVALYNWLMLYLTWRVRRKLPGRHFSMVHLVGLIFTYMALHVYKFPPLALMLLVALDPSNYELVYAIARKTVRKLKGRSSDAN